MTSRRVAVVGGGYSGTVAAAELARAGVHAVLIERGDRFAAGAAYGTREPAHVLNVRAGNMSAFADEPAHFAEWAKAQGLGESGGFVPRRDYHRYLQEILEEAVASGRVQLLQGEVVEAGAGAVVLADGREVACSAVVLAGGNYPSKLPAMLKGPGSVENPWSAEGEEALKRLAAQRDDVLLVGTGLTMVDVALGLVDAGFAGRLIATSRRGLVPRTHEEVGTPPLPPPPAGSLAHTVRAVRAAARAGGWRPAVDSLRPVSRQVWQALSPTEKARFLRHLRPWWDVHRHRIAPAVGARIAELVGTGRLEVIAGRVQFYERGSVTIGVRGGGSVERQVGGIVNCTGPEGRIERVEDPLIRQLLASGQTRPDPLGVGLDVDQDSRIVGRGGAASDRMFALGPLTRGTFWEIVAVPDIRAQARTVAATIAAY